MHDDTPRTLEDFALILRGPATNEVHSLLGELCYEDLTACELVAVAGILRGVWERTRALENPPVVLKMVRSRKPRRPSSRGVAPHPR